MRDIQFNKIGIGILTILLVFMCMPLLFSFVNFENISITQDTQSLSENQEQVYNCGNIRDTGLSTVNQNPMTDIFIQYTYLAQSTQCLVNPQQPSNRKKINGMIIFYGLAYGFFIFTIPNSVYLIVKYSIFEINRHFIIPHSIHAPPYIFT